MWVDDESPELHIGCTRFMDEPLITPEMLYLRLLGNDRQPLVTFVVTACGVFLVGLLLFQLLGVHQRHSVDVVRVTFQAEWMPPTLAGNVVSRQPAAGRVVALLV